ncbi:MAG: hypothetical protein C7N36_18320 [Bacteroidetes bacterium]|nr:MAG: hypothetical protein C7N36_18320 [Bacteroidota bacterium]
MFAVAKSFDRKRLFTSFLVPMKLCFKKGKSGFFLKIADTIQSPFMNSFPQQLAWLKSSLVCNGFKLICWIVFIPVPG